MPTTHAETINADLLEFIASLSVIANDIAGGSKTRQVYRTPVHPEPDEPADGLGA
jgi:hypothetical protein